MRLEGLIVAPLASHPEAVPELCRLFEAEWPAWYGIGGPGNASADLSAASRLVGLPLGVVALLEHRVCGAAILKSRSIPSHEHLCPWAAAGIVEPALRNRGIGSLLLAALEERARRDGYAQIHCATASAEPLLRRRGYVLLERVAHDGQDLGVYQRGL